MRAGRYGVIFLLPAGGLSTGGRVKSPFFLFFFYSVFRLLFFASSFFILV